MIFRLGKIKDQKKGAVGPGAFFTLCCTDTYHPVDMRTVSFDVPPQSILTKDSVTIMVDAVVYYRVFDAIASVRNVSNAAHSTKLLAQTQIRNILGTRTLKQILEDKEAIARETLAILDHATDPWGKI